MSEAPEIDASAPEQDATPRKPGGSPALLLMMAIVVVPAVVVADSFDAGPAAIIGGMVGLFSLVALMGGPLRADLRAAALTVPLLLIGATVPRLLTDASRPAAIALVVVLGFVAALLPLRGPRYANAGLGLGMTTLYSYAYATHGAADHRQVIAAAVAGVLVALLVRVLLGIADPSKPTREQIAEVLLADDAPTATATAFDTWLHDGRQRWLARALESASQYRLALRRAELAASGEQLGPDTLAGLRGRAEELADQLRAKRPPVPDEATTGSGTGPSAAAGPAAALDALDGVEQALRERDTSPVALDRGDRHEFRDAVLHPSGRWRSIQVRHALRTAFGLLVMLLVTSGLEPGDPLVSTVLLTTFAILQASWRDTLDKARNKVIGVVAGSAAVGVILVAVPERYLVAIAAVALILGLWYITSRPALGAGFMVVVSVGFNAVTRDLDPGDLLVQYVALTACAVAVGLVLGFAVVPAFRPAPLRERVESATEATTAVLSAAASGARPSVPELLALHRDAVQKQDELVPDREHLDDRQLAELERLRSGLRDLTTWLDTARPDRAALARAVDLLHEDARTPRRGAEPSTGGASSATLWELAEQSGSAERYLLATLPATR
ncbi:FUSC family protein [Nocardioides ochotonae]|uniref:FUSC family protein n=1 Tax=Nocardioides ochotonae TaxID=2685869 RepID=UPI001409420E|nr:FUSC family protein [Nocardioides ochotonae]